MPIGMPGAAVTHICQASADRVEVRGRDLTRELMGHVSFTEYFYLLLTGRAPTDNQRFFLDLLLVAIANAVVFLASAAAGFVSGVNLVVDGTLTRRIQN